MLRRNIEKTCLWRKARIQSSLEARPRTRYWALCPCASSSPAQAGAHLQKVPDAQ